MPSTDPDQYAPRRASGAPSRRRRTVRNVLLALGALVLVVLVVAGVYVWQVASAFNDKRQTVDAGIATEQAPDGALNILLMGSDSRGEGRDTAENKGEEGQRSDTMMLVHVPADRQDVYVMSIVRDLWVTIPEHGARKVNAALDLGGYPLVTQTMQDLLGVQVDHLAVIDFEGFNGLTSALGGVTVCNPATFSSGQVNPSYFPRGEVLLEGSDALRYVRERKAFAGGDFDRVQNQQRFVAAVVDRLLTARTLADPQRVMDVVDALAPFITVDEGLDAATIAGYGLQLNGIRSGDIHMFTIPHGPPTAGPGGASIVEQDFEAMDDLRAALAGDDLGSFLDEGSGDDGENSGSASTDASSAGATATPDGAGASADGGSAPSADATASEEAPSPSDAGATPSPTEPAASATPTSPAAACAGA
ncbi:LytR family transcriptional regulator [Citricoccus sp. SGAir0253]|uniref:LCP family protein n=1 Tax=Citricoccus sp. SGAir0253 TaxID=2567881 RepID=UPI0010CD68FD|nr:LCP family protein [Citricoccus sp. SGAir0253]QCU78359.1 LytR family transcriptional regulator [Citricoccus sp. SGAir0253]